MKDQKQRMRAGQDYDDLNDDENSINDIKIDDVMKGMKQQIEPVQKMGMVPVLDPKDDNSQHDNPNDNEDDDKDFDPLQNF